MAELRKTVCNRDCPDACSIVATVENGKVVKIGGDPDHPITDGFLCYRTNHFLHTQYAPDRLLEPLWRDRLDEPFRAVSWDEALDGIAARLLKIKQESGPASIFHYRSGGSLGLLKHLSDYFFERFGPVTLKRGDICSGAGDHAQVTDFGVEDSSDPEDLVNAKHILLWGKNVFVSSPHLIPILKRARARGAELVLIDPAHHRTASLCQEYLQPRPGGDLSLALAVARLVFQRGAVPADAAARCDHLPGFRALAESRSVADWCADADVTLAQAEGLARRLADRPAAILVGWGMGRRVNGSSIVRALDALCALSGNLGLPGGGVSFYYQRRGPFDLTFIGGIPAAPRSISEPLFGQEILAATDPPIRAVWITAGNPVAMLPDSETNLRALRSRELVVVVDSFMTDTAQAAHVVLPTTTLLEADDLLGAYGHHYLGVATPVVPPPPGVKSDLEIVQALAARLGLGLSDALAGSARDWKRRFLAAKLAPAGVTLEALEEKPRRNPLAAPVLFADGLPQNVNLMTELPPIPDGTRPDADYPLTLLSLSTERAQSSQWVRHEPDPDPDGPALVTVHPSIGLPDGVVARLESRVGAMVVRVKHDPRQRRDVAIVPKGGSLARGRCANALLRARTTDAGEGGALYDEPVRLVPL